MSDKDYVFIPLRPEADTYESLRETRCSYPNAMLIVSRFSSRYLAGYFTFEEAAEIYITLPFITDVDWTVNGIMNPRNEIKVETLENRIKRKD